jgi:hypothetical protein
MRGTNQGQQNAQDGSVNQFEHMLMGMFHPHSTNTNNRLQSPPTGPTNKSKFFNGNNLNGKPGYQLFNMSREESKEQMLSNE